MKRYIISIDLQNSRCFGQKMGNQEMPRTVLRRRLSEALKQMNIVAFI
jgi:hypothetical protein